MPKFKKPKHKKQSILKKTIKALETNQDDYISFSFKFFVVTKKFNPYGEEVNYFINLLERKRELCRLLPIELLSNRSKTLRCHPISWKETSEMNFGLKNEEQLVDTPYQLSVSSNEFGRIHGFFIKAVFYVVWLDPKHNLYL